MNRKNGKRKQSGQAIGELMILLPSISSIFIFCFLFFYIFTQHLWMDHHLYQSLICLAEGETQARCKNRFREKTNPFLFIGKITNLKFHENKWQWKGSFIWENFFGSIHFNKELQPIKGL